MKILTLIDAYLPAYKHGGPVRSVAAMVAHLPRTYEFWILTRDRDLGDRAPFPGVMLDRWTDRHGARVLYLSRRAVTLGRLVEVIRDARPDVVYANSLFSRLTVRYLAARRLGFVPRTPFVLAPRGELSPGALRQKRYKKRPFLEVAKRAGLFKDVLWQASTEMERGEIMRALDLSKGIVVSQNICVARDLVYRWADTALQRREKIPGAARFTFVSRIVRKKNLLAAIEAVRNVKGDVTFDIFGPLEDRGYWATCARKIERLPPNVRVQYQGELAHEQVADTFSRHHFFVFPTLSENFGHVIIESLSAGCPVVISDQTPWRNLEARRAGWDIPLADLGRWSEVLQRCVDMGSAEHQSLSEGAMRASAEFMDVGKSVQQNTAMFELVRRR